MGQEVQAQKVYTAEEVAEALRVTPARIYELVREGKMPAVRLGRTVRITADQLEQFIREGGRK